MDNARKNRPIWTTPSESDLLEELQSFKVLDDGFHLPRLRTIHEEFGPPTDMLIPGGVPAAIALHELKLAYVLGMDISAIMNAHIFVEQVLGAGLIMTKFEKNAEKGLGVIINTLLANGDISTEIANSLRLLKEIRISYFHPHVGLQKRSFMGRFMNSGVGNPYDFIPQDAKTALQAVADLIRFHNPDQKPT